MMPVVVAGERPGCGSPVTGSMKSSGERRTREIEPSSWANLMTSACWASTARMTICCWPLRAVPGSPSSGARRGAVGVRRRAAAGAACRGPACPGGATLTLVLLRPATTVNVSSAGLTRDDRELVAGEADDHVDVVAGLDDRADAGDLVDLDRHAREAGRAVDVDDRRRQRHRSGSSAVICCAGGDRLAGDLADDLGRRR